MNGQMAAIIGDLEAANIRLRELGGELPHDAWLERPAPERWSPAECLAHLNLSSAAILPCLREALQAARTSGAPVRPRYRLGAMGWLLRTLIGPESWITLTAPNPFTPRDCETVDCLVARFDALQAELIAIVREAEGLPIDAVRLVSPFDARIRTNLYAALVIVPRHQHRHLQQAARAAGTGVTVPAGSLVPA